MPELSPTLAASFLGCPTSAGWSIQARRGLRPAAPDVRDPQLELIAKKGLEHEARCLSELQRGRPDFLHIGAGPLEARVAATLEGMRNGASLIYQGALRDGSWVGYPDFLLKVDQPSAQLPWSYEPWDAKLARQPRPEHLLQIAVYGDLLTAIQGSPATRGALMLGTGDPARPYQLAAFNLDDCRYYVRRLARKFEVFAGNLTALNATPEPCGYCPKCGWQPECEARWEAVDHLSRVADITKAQIRRLNASGVFKVSELASQAGDRIPGIGLESLNRLVRQARLQKEAESSGRGAYEFLTSGPGRGFDRLPLPDPDDFFFDFEGDPLYPGGLEYLCGVLWRGDLDEQGGTPVPGHPGLYFRAFWAHDRDQERHAFAELIEFLTARLNRSPGAHLYHYAPYEKTAIRRLASMHGVAEVEVDDLLRGSRMVDLYRVVRESLQVGEPSYSIKNIEHFYMNKRDTAVVSGGDSLVIYDRYRQSGDPRFLDDLRDYNRDDCVSTLLLREWLIARAVEASRWPPNVEERIEDVRAEARKVARLQLEQAQTELEAALIAPSRILNETGRHLMADLIGFHRREAKPAWWAFFDRQERSDEELLDDGDCLAFCVADGPTWSGQEKRSLTFRYRFPEQETKLRAGMSVCFAEDGDAAGSVLELDEASLTVTLKRGSAKGPLPPALSLIPSGPLDDDILRQAVWRVAEDMRSGGAEFPHIASILNRDLPRLRDYAPGASIVPQADRDSPDRVLDAAKRAVHSLDQSWLVIQGPPGAGKTFTTSHLMVSLIKAGMKVGIASNSHKAIDNVLHAVEKRLEEAGEGVRVLGQKKDSSDEGYRGLGYIESVASNSDIDPDAQILGGTAWLFARPELGGTRDVLFVDEAGQVSLANLIAMATAAKSVVLVGDQMQLGQPIQGAHPRDSGRSALVHLLGGHAVVPPERGIFLSTTWRMHPDLCQFVSLAAYEGKLISESHCSNQRLVLDGDAHPILKPAGLSFVSVDHSGCRQRSIEEANVIRDIFDSLLRQEVVDQDGRPRPMTLDDVLVVAPYNMQVNLLRSVLPQGARVGTVDKFQGQEAEAVIVSMTTSGGEDMPRDASFLLSQNRFNVAISRAKCLAILVASPGLLDLPATSVEEMRLTNLFCWAADYARGL